MRKTLLFTILTAVCAVSAFGQRAVVAKEAREFSDIIRSESRNAETEAKWFESAAQAATTPSPFNDTDSFGQNTQFIGSLYAGTVYIYRSCDPAVLQSELDLTLAADDKCVVHDYPTSSMATSEFYDNMWEITIPKNTVSNVIYPMLNNRITWDASSGIPGQYGYLYIPRVTIVSTALNSPQAINPTTGLPMNGSFTTSLPGSKVLSQFSSTGDFANMTDSYASVAGRGFSRAYFRAIGLPNNVINDLFKKEMKLRFGIRVRAFGRIDYADFSYTFRLLGQ